jgi:hypothetical protein
MNDGESRVSFDIFNQFPHLISFQKLKGLAKSNHLFPIIKIWSGIEQSIRLQAACPQNAEELWDYVSIMW